MEIRKALGGVVGALVLGLGGAAAQAAILTVDTELDVVDGGDGVLSLREAIADANPGDEIQFDSSLNGETIVLSGTQLTIDKNLTITGLGATQLTIDGDLLSRVFQINAGVTATITGLTITRGGGGLSGAGINSFGSLSLVDSVVTLNQGPPNMVGGGISTSTGPLSLTRCTVSSNTGEGIRGQSGPVTIVDSTISDNTSTGFVAASGGSPVLIVGSTISGNAGVVGGGIANGSGGAIAITMVNSTVSGNTATAFGGGIWASSAPLTLLNSTITNNTATNEGGGISRGVFGGSGNVVIHNSIVAGNTAPVDADCATNVANGMYVTDDHNLFGLNTGCPVGATDRTTETPAKVLGPLADNGGSTETHALIQPAANPAVDGGDPTGCTDELGAPLTTDQRDAPRPLKDFCDIGAFESATNGPVLPPGGRLALAAALLVSALTASRLGRGWLAGVSSEGSDITA